MSGQDVDLAPKELSSPESDSNRSRSSATVPEPRRRASRAGSRTVNTLSPAQLEKKRMNDREAQRAIRQRTKDRIESLEQRINELTNHPGSSDQLVTALKRTKQLEEENSSLRARLEAAGIPVSSERTGSWEGLPTSRPMPQLLDLSGHQAEDTIMIARAGSEDQGNPYTYRHTSHWQTTHPFHEDIPIKMESSPSPRAQLTPQEFSAWSMNQSRPTGQAGATEIPQPVGYFGNQHVASSQSQTGDPVSMQALGIPPYGPVHQQYIQHGQHLPRQQQKQRLRQESQHSRPQTSRPPSDQTSHGSQQMFYGNFSGPP